MWVKFIHTTVQYLAVGVSRLAFSIAPCLFVRLQSSAKRNLVAQPLSASSTTLNWGREHRQGREWQ
jgi:hypothetical protein